MISIITSDGTALDLDKDSSFAIEMENPLFEDELIPTAFSTQIAFPRTPQNLKVFGYTGFALFGSQNKQIGASIQVDGVPLFSGRLEYDSIDDGKINYTFTGKNPEDDWSGKIWERNFFGSIPSDPASVFSDIYKGDRDGVFAPPLVNKSMTGSADSSPLKLSTKYHNETDRDTVYTDISPSSLPLWRSGNVFTPAFLIKTILTDEFSNMEIDGSISPYLQILCIIGIYKPHTDTSVNGWPATDVHIESSLPDVTAGELIKNLLKMFCAVLFLDGSGYRIIPAETFLSAAEAYDWTDRFSDTWSSEREEGKGYKFGYANDDSENTLDTENAEGIRVFDSLYESLRRLSSATPNTMHSTLGDVYSYSAGGPDMVWHNRDEFAEGDDKEGSFDNSCEFDLVRILPMLFSIATVSEGSSITGDLEYYSYRMYRCAAIVEPGKLGERGSKMYVGIVPDRHQICDKGIVFEENVLQADLTASAAPDSDCGLSIAPQDLYEKFHKKFAEWIQNDRQVVKAQLNLSLIDIANFRMWHKVLIHGRQFFVRKLSLSLDVNKGTVETEGEFVSA